MRKDFNVGNPEAGTAQCDLADGNKHDGAPRSAGEPLPRPKCRRRRAKADRGLPSDEELGKLAAACLQRQRMHWPKLLSSGLLPEPQSEVVQQLVDDFKERHRTGKVDEPRVRPYLIAEVPLGGCYSRYSCDNSSPTSIVDQLINELDKARSENRFIPWQYVFADFSVTGLDATRQGYSSYKKALAAKENLIETTYIDDFTRASRDELEWWKLAALSKRLNKRMIGASDGFDVNSPDWDIKITLYGLISRLFIKQLREKVKRGMRGAVRRGTCLGRLPLGFTRRERRDSDGNLVVGPDGLPKYEPCIDPATQEIVRWMYDLFVERNWSAFRIAKHFNEQGVDDWSGWSESSIKMRLYSATSIGVFVWYKTRREYDHETGKWVVVTNARSDWAVHYDPNLAIVPRELWCAARRKLAEMRSLSPITGKRTSRNQISATTLFSGSLFCQDCGQELKLYRSTSKYKQFCCLNGKLGAHNCQLSTSKSSGMVEECLLGYLRDQLLTETRITALVRAANAYVDQEALKPRPDVARLRENAKKLESKIKRLIDRVGETEDKKLSDQYATRARDLNRELNELKDKIRAAEGFSGLRVKPLSIDQAKVYLAEIRETLNQEVPLAAEAIRQLTGPITIRQEAIPGKRDRARWIASFCPDLAKLLRRVAKEDPGINSLMGTSEQPAIVEVVIERVPAYRKLAVEFERLILGGASIVDIAATHSMSENSVRAILHCAETGKRPDWRANRTVRNKSKKYVELAAEVARLRDQEGMAFEHIAKYLSCSMKTVQRAYGHVHQGQAGRGAAIGKRIRRVRFKHLSEDSRKEAIRLLKEGAAGLAIASAIGCSSTTVYRLKRELQGNLDEVGAAEARTD